jgi:outer membrane protein OmpA-like peptidoglycan-associated protein
MSSIIYTNSLVKLTLLILSIIFLISCVSQQTRQPPTEADTRITPIKPIHTTDSRITEPVIRVKNPVYDSVETDVLLDKADTALENKKYEKALLLFELAAKRSDTPWVRTYAGLYQTHLKLKHTAAAEKAFRRLLEASFKKSDKLNFKFLFSVNSSEFINDADLRNEYSFWLRQIARYLADKRLCSHIVGHSTVTEEIENEDLSLLRAKKIQKLMAMTFPAILQKSRLIGKGANETLVGTNSNNVMDTIDRRVEIVLVDC